MPPKVKFEVADSKILAGRIWGFVRHSSSFEVCKNRVFKLNQELFQKIKIAENFEEIENDILGFVKANTEENLKQKTIALQKNWDKINDKFFTRINNFFNVELPSKEFIGYTTDLMIGNYGEDNEFVVRLTDNLEVALFVAMEEIFHLVYWSYWKRIFGDANQKPWLLREDSKNSLSVWKISEVIPEYFFDFKGKPSRREKSYPWLIQAKKLLNPLWQESNSNLELFLIKSHKLCELKS